MKKDRNIFIIAVMGEVIYSGMERFAVKRREVQRTRALNTVLELQGPTGNSNNYGTAIAEFMTLDDMIVKGERFTTRQLKSYNGLKDGLENAFGIKMMEVLRAWNEAGNRRKGIVTKTSSPTRPHPIRR